MRRGLLDGRDVVAVWAFAAAVASPERLSIYRNTSRSALTKALRLNYPAVHSLVGDDFFAAAADAFIVREPPHSAWLDLYGGVFPEFLAGFEPAAALAYLADVARLERSVSRAFHAHDADPLDCSRLANLEPSVQGRVCFTPSPTVSLLSSAYPVDAIWRAVLAKDDGALAAMDLSSGAVHLLIERCAGEVGVTRLDEGRWKFAEALFSGRSLAAALALADDPDAATWLAAHLAKGNFSDFALSEQDNASPVTGRSQ